jgi:hypothetical protein
VGQGVGVDEGGKYLCNALMQPQQSDLWLGMPAWKHVLSGGMRTRSGRSTGVVDVKEDSVAKGAAAAEAALAGMAPGLVGEVAAGVGEGGT